eukprot:m.239376 g.239376  ORF g.239376 m.239376 type:complete len:351 (-) comp16067_c1_seq3:984-2036(-)
MADEDTDSVGRAVAVALFEGTEPKELPLQIGDLVAISFKGDNGWWVGTNLTSREEGIFPSTFVTEDIEENDKDLLEAMDNLSAMMLAESVPTEDLSLDMIFDSIGSEVAGAASQAIQMELIRPKEIKKPDTVLYLTSQVVSIMLLRSIECEEGIVLASGGILVQGMLPDSFDVTFEAMIEAKLMMRELNIADDEPMLAILHQSFLPTKEVEEIQNHTSVKGEKMRKCSAKITQIAKVLTQQAVFEQRYEKLCLAAEQGAAAGRKPSLKDVLSSKFAGAKESGARAFQMGKEKAGPALSALKAKGMLFTKVIRDAVNRKFQGLNGKDDKLISECQKKQPPPRPPPPQNSLS